MKRTTEDLLVTAFGAATSLATAFLLWKVEDWFGFSFYTWMFWFIIPAGALISGFAAAAGYYWGARLFDHRPGRMLLANILLVSVGTFFVVHYLSYYNLEIDGAPLRERIPFLSYLNTVLTHASMTFRIHAARVGSSGELGAWGYVFALLQILGFAGGGAGIYLYLTDLPFCARCEKYLKKVSDVERFAVEPAQVDTLLGGLKPLFAEGRLSEAAALHTGQGTPKYKKGDGFRTTLTTYRCQSCTHGRLRFALARRSGSDWKDVTEAKLEASSDSPLVVPGGM